MQSVCSGEHAARRRASGPAGSNSAVAGHVGSLALALIVLAVGCGPSRAPAPKTDDKSKVVSRQAEDILQSALFQMSPGNWAVDADPRAAVGLLNQWLELAGNLGTRSGSDTRPRWDEYPSSWEIPGLTERLKLTTYDGHDGAHICASQLTHTIVGYLTPRGTSELSQVLAVLEFVNRNIALTSEDDEPLPLGIYERLLFGNGVPEDRALVLAALLRQLRIDSVVLQAKGATNDDPWLFGVVSDHQVYLFDLGLGLPVPAPAADGGVDWSRPATLVEAKAAPQCLQALTARSDQPYPLNSDDLDGLQPYLLTPPQCWERRMFELEQVLPADRECVLADPLFGTPEAPGSIARLTAANPSWTEETIAVWRPSLASGFELERVSPAQRQVLQDAFDSFAAPLEIGKDDNGQLRVMSKTNHQLRSRLTQLDGDWTKATEMYVRIRLLGLEAQRIPIVDLARAYSHAADDAYFWSSLCKVEQEDFAEADQNLSDYIRRFRRGRWLSAARLTLAQIRAKQNNFAGAIEVAAQVISNSEDPNRAALVLLQKQWQDRLSPTAETSKAGPAETQAVTAEPTEPAAPPAEAPVEPGAPAEPAATEPTPPQPAPTSEGTPGEPAAPTAPATEPAP